MNRMQILITPKLRKALQVRARSQQTSVSRLIRDIITKNLDHDDAQVGLGALQRMAAQARRGGVKNLSKKIDETLYLL